MIEASMKEERKSIRQRWSTSACIFGEGARSFLGALWQPAADLYRTNNGWLAKFDLAGIKPEDVRIQIQGPRLTVHGVRRDWLIEEGCCYHSMEIAYSEFERSVDFPASLDRARITTDYQAGMLLVRIQMEKDRP
jgi:HSP20 family protein